MIKFDFWKIIIDTLGLILKFWPIWVVAIFLGLVRVIFERLGYEIDDWVIRKKFRQGEKWRSGREIINWLRQMKADEFEKYTADIFKRLDYDVKVTGGSYDGGVDVIAEKNGIKYYVQCKRYTSKNEVGVGAVRDFYGALADRVANGKGYIVTTGKFTLEAERFAEDKPIELVDSHRLLDYIRLANGETKVAEISSTSLLKCPRCRKDLVERIGKFGKFLGCSGFPKCKFTKKI